MKDRMKTLWSAGKTIWSDSKPGDRPETVGPGTVGPNPYVGPRPLEPGEPLYGREDEITDLYYLWNAERIVLLHSPSGAGKSSLLQAGLLPRLKGSYDVWGPTRVNHRVPGALSGAEGPAGGAVNRYALSAMQGFEQGVPERLRRPPEELAGQTLLEYFEKRPRRRKAPKSVALLFDQFEEVLTVDPLAAVAKREFFDQLGALLHNPHVWALFVLREDYLAPLDPYVRQVPTHLRNRFRIDMLGLDGAREAIVNPARESGREFPAADRLLHDLATQKVQQADGTFREQTGHHVEPVQLQVVCRRLWGALPADDLSIDEEDLAQFGDVTEALAGYYGDSVTRIAGGNEHRERAIRDWFDEALITTGGIRGQVLKGAAGSILDQETIELLLDTHLVRADERAGATWYELAHDRLIAPVRESNGAWRDEHLSEVQQRAAMWERQGRPPGLLMKEDELEAERWTSGSVVATEVELLFLDESRKALEITRRERRQALRIRRLAVASIVVGALAVFASVLAVKKTAEAELAHEKALEQREEAARQGLEQAMQLLEAEKGREAAKRALEAIGKAVEQTRDDAPASPPAVAGERDRAGETEPVSAVAVTTRLRLVAEAEALAERAARMTGTSSQGDSARELAALLARQAYRLDRRFGGGAQSAPIYEALRLAVDQLGADRPAMHGHRQVAHGHQAAVRSFALAPDGRTLATGGEDGELRVIDLEQPDRSGEVIGSLGAGAGALAWSDDGRQLAGAGLEGRVQIWDAARLRSAPRVVAELGSPVHALAFQPGRGASDWLAVGAASDSVHLVSLDAASGQPDVVLRGASAEAAGGEAADADPEAASRSLPNHALAWSHDGSSLAAASQGLGVSIWNIAQAAAEPRLLGPGIEVRSVTWSGDGRLLAAGTAAGAIAIWELAKPGDPPLRLLGHGARIDALRFHPRRYLLASGSRDGSLRLWDADRPNAPPVVLERPVAPEARQVTESAVWAAAFSLDGDRLISASGEGTIRFWPPISAVLAAEVCQIISRGLTREEWREYLPDEVAYEPVCPG